MHAEIGFNCETSHEDDVVRQNYFNGQPVFAVQVLLRHRKERLYFIMLQGIDDGDFAVRVQQEIAVLPVQLADVGFNDLMVAKLLCSIRRTIDLALYGFGHTDDAFVRDLEYPTLKGAPLFLCPSVSDLKCVVDLD